MTRSAMHVERWTILPRGSQVSISIAAAVLLLAGCVAGLGTPLDQMVRQATAPDEHRRLAERYREKAAAARSRAAYHERIAVEYRGRRVAGGPEARELEAEMARFSEALVYNGEAAAILYDALAIDHETLARLQAPPNVSGDLGSRGKERARASIH